jgi:hypothetical protein
VSGGLTIDASGAEMHTTIISVGPSTLERGVIWVGTDDGNVQITQDGGENWLNVRDNIVGLPHGIWIPDVQPSKHEPARAYLVAEDHRRGNWEPHVYVTEDYGSTWTSLSSPSIAGFVHAIEEDPESENLLFLGTEFGLRVSFDRGQSWEKYTSGVPSVPIRDLVVHPRDADLVLGTHGRALIVLDDIRPLRELAEDPSIRGATVHVFGPPPAYALNIAEAIGYRSTGHAMQQAETRANGAILTFWTAEEGDADVEITNEEGALVYSHTVSATAGANRIVWDLRPGGDSDEAVFPPQMPVFPGTYQVSVSAGALTSATSLSVMGDPRNPVSIADLVAKRDALLQMAAIGQREDDARDELTRLLNAVETVLETLAEDADALREQGETLRGELQALNERLFTGPECQGGCGGDVVADLIGRPMERVAGETGGPSANTIHMMNQARAAADTIESELEAISAGSVAAYTAALLEAGYTPFGGE